MHIKQNQLTWHSFKIKLEFSLVQILVIMSSLSNLEEKTKKLSSKNVKQREKNTFKFFDKKLYLLIENGITRFDKKFTQKRFKNRWTIFGHGRNGIENNILYFTMITQNPNQ